jgi:hypothetical protein
MPRHNGSTPRGTRRHHRASVRPSTSWSRPGQLKLRSASKDCAATGKRRYANQRDAQRVVWAAVSARQLDPHSYRHECRTYYCHDCRGWHTTSWKDWNQPYPASAA